jgi:hypothetical protein
MLSLCIVIIHHMFRLDKKLRTSLVFVSNIIKRSVFLKSIRTNGVKHFIFCVS